MKVIKIFGDCGREPVRLACFPSGNLSHMGIIIIGNDESVGKLLSYELHVRCTEADVDHILDIAGFEDFSDGETGRITPRRK